MLSLKEFKTEKVSAKHYSQIKGGGKTILCTTEETNATCVDNCPDTDTITTVSFSDNTNCVYVNSNYDYCG